VYPIFNSSQCNFIRISNCTIHKLCTAFLWLVSPCHLVGFIKAYIFNSALLCMSPVVVISYKTARRHNPEFHNVIFTSVRTSELRALDCYFGHFSSSWLFAKKHKMFQAVDLSPSTAEFTETRHCQNPLDLSQISDLNTPNVSEIRHRNR
jgi:hypothetical protein